MLTEQGCWKKIIGIVGKVGLSTGSDKSIDISDSTSKFSIAEIEKLEAYVKAILIGRRVEALEEG